MSRKFPFISSSQPSTSVEVGDIWVDTSSSPIIKKCDSVDPIVFTAVVTKEFFVSPTVGTEAIEYGYHCGYKIDADPDVACIEFFVPNDFSSIIAVVVTLAAGGTSTYRLNFRTEYAAAGEGANTHSDTLIDQDLALSATEITEVDISSLFGSLAAGDYVGVRISGDAVNVPNVVIFGVRVKYS